MIQDDWKGKTAVPCEESRLPGFAEQISAFLPELRRAARRLSDTEEEADDLVQETVTAAVANQGQLRNPDLVGAWLLEILRRKRMDVLRCRYRDKERLPPNPNRGGSPPEEDREGVRRAMCALRPDERRALELKYFESRTSEEIGVALGRSAGSVRALVFHALRKFETAYRDQERESES